MTEELLLEAEFESASNPPYGFSHIVSPAQFVLQAGAEYRVVYDGVEYDCTGIDAATLGDGAVGIGNGAAFGLPGSGEPFCFGTFGGAAIVVCLIDTEPTQHSITVYKTVKESGLVTENYDGSQIVHPGVETVSLYNTEGGIETFVHDSLVAEPVEATVELDFSGGDMVITPAQGKVLSGVNIPVPANLIPENIAEGVNIAGIIGALVAGGGSGGGIAVASGMVIGNNMLIDKKITHGLGVMPDLLVVFPKSGIGTSGKLAGAVYLSPGFAAKCSTDISSNQYELITSYPGVASKPDTGFSVDSTSITFTSTPYAAVYYAYIAIGGLT